MKEEEKLKGVTGSRLTSGVGIGVYPFGFGLRYVDQIRSLASNSLRSEAGLSKTTRVAMLEFKASIESVLEGRSERRDLCDDFDGRGDFFGLRDFEGFGAEISNVVENSTKVRLSLYLLG